MNIKYRKKLFFRFLKENECYYQFMLNIKLHSYWASDLNELIEMSNKTKYANEICNGFNWCKVTDKIDWHEIAIKWSDILFKIDPNRDTYYF